MSRKIRQLLWDYRRAGGHIDVTKGKGSHRKITHPKVPCEVIEFLFRLHGLWEGVIPLPPPPEPPYDVETIEPLDFPPVTLWNGDVEAPPPIWLECGAPVRPHPELQLDQERVLVLDGDPAPQDDCPVYWAN